MAIDFRFTSSDVERFDELSWWAHIWLLRDGLPVIAGIDPSTGTAEEIAQIKGVLCRNRDTIDELGEYGPQFCAWFDQLSDEFTILAAGAGGVLSAELGFVNDPPGFPHRTHYGIPVEIFLSAHAAAAAWITRIGQLFWSSWDESVQSYQCYSPPFFTRLDDDPDGTIRDQELLNVATTLQRVCWAGRGRDVLEARLSQERILFRHYADTATEQDDDDPKAPFLGLTIDPDNKTIRRKGFKEPVLCAGKPEQWPVIQRLINHRDRGVSSEQLRMIDKFRTSNAWRALKNSINNTLAPLEIRVRSREWMLEPIKS